MDARADLVWLPRVRETIDRDLALPLDVEQLARGVNVSARHLSREFRRAYGVSPYAYLTKRRMDFRRGAPEDEVA